MPFMHVSVRTSDMDRSIAFYRDHLGMDLERRREIPSNNAEIAFLRDTGSPFSLEITWYKGQKEFAQAEYEKRTFDHLAFVVEDVRGLVERMRSDGVTISDEPFKMGDNTLAFIEDPDGTLIELIEKGS